LFFIFLDKKTGFVPEDAQQNEQTILECFREEKKFVLKSLPFL